MSQITTAETAARFINELAETGIDDAEVVTELAKVAIAEHCRMHGGPVVDVDRQWKSA